MERIEPTRALALRVWWSFTWRTALGALAVGCLAGVLLGIVSLALRLEDNSALAGVVYLACVPIAVWVSVEVMYRVLKKKFRGFEIALLKTP